jgi:hypothetical protein
VPVAPGTPTLDGSFGELPSALGRAPWSAAPGVRPPSGVGIIGELGAFGRAICGGTAGALLLAGMNATGAV